MQTELPAHRPTSMQVSLAFVDQRVNVWLRFGKPARETVLNRWRRVAVFDPGAVCCRVKWIANDYGTTLWQLMVLQAPTLIDARILLRADGELQVKALQVTIDSIEALGVDPCTVAVTYWRTAGNRLAARQPLPEYTSERHAAYIARGALQ